MKKYLLFFIVVFVYRLISNIANLLILAFVADKYEHWIKGEENYFLAYSAFLYKGIHKAGFRLSNVDVLCLDDYIYISNAYTRAMSIFISRIIENFNPLFWIDTLIYLPKTIFGYLGVSPERIIVKIFQILWWIITPIALLFREKLWEALSKLIQFF